MDDKQTCCLGPDDNLLIIMDAVILKICPGNDKLISNDNQQIANIKIL